MRSFAFENASPGSGGRRHHGRRVSKEQEGQEEQRQEVALEEGKKAVANLRVANQLEL